MGIDIVDMTEEELEIELRNIEESKVDFGNFKLNFLNLINDSEELSSQRYHLMDELRSMCDNEDRLILPDIEENQNILIYEQQRRKDITDTLNEEAKKQQNKWEYYEEDVRAEIKLRKDTKNHEEESNT